MISIPKVEPAVKLPAKIARLLKSATYPPHGSHLRDAAVCIQCVYADEQGTLVATDGKRMVIVHRQTAMSPGLWRPQTGRTFIRDHATEATVREARGKRGLFVEWRDYVTAPYEYQPEETLVSYSTLSTAIQGACVRARAYIDWVLFADTVRAIEDIYCDEIRVKCPVDNTRPTMVEMYKGKAVFVQAIFMPYNGDR